MLSSADLKKIVAEARPLIEQQLDLTEQVAGLRDVVTAAGGDWSQLKALVKAQIQDERDEAGDGKRVRKILDKADYAASYADMLGLANMNEKNSFADEIEGIDPQLLAMLVEGSQTEVGRSIIFAALKAVQDGETDFQPDTGEINETDIPVSTSSTAVRKDAPNQNATGQSALNAGEAGTQVPPVDTHPRHGAGGAEDEVQVATVGAPSSAQPIQAETPNDAPMVVDGDSVAGRRPLQASLSTFHPAGNTEGKRDGADHSPAAIHSQPVEGTTPTSAADGDRSGQVPPPSQPAPVATRNDYTKPNPWCRDPEDCGIHASWNHMCGGCIRLKAERQAVEAVQ